MSDWQEKAKAAGPVVLGYMRSIVEGNKPASPDVARRLVGMILRGDNPIEAVPNPEPNPEPKPEPTADVELCATCEGTGKVTNDSAGQSLAAIMREIEKDESEGIASRTKDAVESGALTFSDCPMCDGSGRAPA